LFGREDCRMSTGPELTTDSSLDEPDSRNAEILCYNSRRVIVTSQIHNRWIA
jgi:hypothetical protein